MDIDRYEQTVRKHKDRVFSYAGWILRDREEARDVSQEVLVKLWHNRSKVREEAAKSWLLKTTHHLCIDRIRRRKVRGEVSSEEQVIPEVDPGPTPERLFRSGETGDAIASALEKLAAADRAIVLLREVQGLPYDEIAETLALPLGTVKAKLHRARERLRRDLTVAGVAP